MNGLDIIKIREEFGFTPTQFAKFIGIDRRTVVNWENGRLIPESKVLLIEMLLEKKRNNKKNPILEENPEKKLELIREISELKDHIKTLKSLVEEKTIVLELYRNENSKLKDELDALKGG